VGLLSNLLRNKFYDDSQPVEADSSGGLGFMRESSVWCGVDQLQVRRTSAWRSPAAGITILRCRDCAVSWTQWKWPPSDNWLPATASPQRSSTAPLTSSNNCCYTSTSAPIDYTKSSRNHRSDIQLLTDSEIDIALNGTTHTVAVKLVAENRIKQNAMVDRSSNQKEMLWVVHYGCNRKRLRTRRHL